MKTVDVSKKPDSERKAVALGRVYTTPDVIELLKEREIEKGDVLEISKAVGLLGAKQVPLYFPFCHPLLITDIEVDIKVFDIGILEISAIVKNVGKTGVEIEAITAVSLTALNIYDMLKRYDRWIKIGEIQLVEKSGGKSGYVKREFEFEGRVLKVAKSGERGLKEPQEEIKLIENFGVEADVHAGTEREVSVFPLEALRLVPSQVLRKINPLEMTENILMVGIPDYLLLPGKKLKIGKTLLEITEIGKEEYVDSGKPYVVSRWGRFCKVIKGGTVEPGDSVRLLL